MEKEIKIVIVGDFLIFRTGLKVLLETEPGFRVLGETADLGEAAKIAAGERPDILIIEAAEIDNGNIDAFVSASPRIPILALTHSRQTEKHQRYLELGIEGIFSKERDAQTLFRAIRQVSAGEIWVERRLMGDMIKQLVKEKAAIPELVYSYNCAVLTKREREVVTLICQGMKNRVIAESLFITETTVRHHLTSIFDKLSVNSRLELVVHAFNEKLVEIPAEKARLAVN